MTKYRVVRAYTIYFTVDVEGFSRGDADEKGAAVIADDVFSLSLPNCQVLERNLEDYQDCEEIED